VNSPPVDGARLALPRVRDFGNGGGSTCSNRDDPAHWVARRSRPSPSLTGRYVAVNDRVTSSE